MVVEAILLVVGVACQSSDHRARPKSVQVKVSVVDELGRPVVSADLKVIGNSQSINITGTRELTINQPVAGTVEADGYLTEPFVIDPTDVSITIKLFSRVGPSGAERIAMQFGGDVMMGRRFQHPEGRTDTPLVTSEAGARSVVRHVAPIMAAADVSMANVETVVGNLPSSGAYPAKRYLLQSPPTILAGLQDLGIDLATLGNNHAYDWKEPGITSTTSAL